MSDILEKLLGVEKNASVLITEAEAEANHRKTAARMDAQKRYAELVAAKAAELDAALEEARKRLSSEREDTNKGYAADLRGRKLDTDAFRRAVMNGFGKAK